MNQITFPTVERPMGDHVVKMPPEPMTWPLVVVVVDQHGPVFGPPGIHPIGAAHWVEGAEVPTYETAVDLEGLERSPRYDRGEDGGWVLTEICVYEPTKDGGRVLPIDGVELPQDP